MKKLLILILFVSLSLFPNEINAAEKADPIIRVSPLIFNISLSPGKQYEYEILIENLTSSPLPLKAYLENFTTTDEEGGYDFQNNAPNPLFSWIDLSTQDMIIPPKSQRTLNFKVNIPKKVPFGGYYAILFLEPLIAQKTDNNTLVSTKVGALLLANVGTTGENKAEILDFSSPKIVQGENLATLLRVRNTGTHHFSAKPILSIKPLIGATQNIELEEKFVFPGKVRRWEQNIVLQNKWRGIYKAEISVSTGGGKQTLDTSYFLSFPISNTLAIVLIVSAFLFIIFKKNRVRKAIRILLNKK